MYTPKFTSPPVLTVSQIDNYIRSVVQSDPRLMNVIVTGEITDMKSPFSGAKHNYFMLKDSGAVISAAMFIGDARTADFSLSSRICSPTVSARSVLPLSR